MRDQKVQISLQYLEHGAYVFQRVIDVEGEPQSIVAIATVTVLVNEPAKTLAGIATATVASTLIVPRPAPAADEALKYLTGAPEAPGRPRFV